MTDYRKRLEALSSGGAIYGMIWGDEASLREDLRSLLSEADRLRALVDEAGNVVEQLADELESEVMHSGGSPRQIKRDMEPVVNARSLLTKLKGEGQ